MIYKLWTLLRMDGLTFNMLAKECLSTFRKNDNPLPSLRKYLERNGINIPVYYVDKPFKMKRRDVFEFVCTKPVPLILVMSLKVDGYHEKIDIRVVTLDSCKVDPDGIINYI